MPTDPRRNRKFAHAKLTGPDGSPAVCVIVDVFGRGRSREQTVKYRNTADGAVYSKPTSSLDRFVLRWIDDDES